MREGDESRRERGRRGERTRLEATLGVAAAVDPLREKDKKGGAREGQCVRRPSGRGREEEGRTSGDSSVHSGAPKSTLSTASTPTCCRRKKGKSDRLRRPRRGFERRQIVDDDALNDAGERERETWDAP